MSFLKKDPLPDLHEILTNLRNIANKVRTDPDYCEDMYEQLAGCGYVWSGYEIDFENKVMKLFSVAVNEAIQKKVNLSLIETEEEEENNLHSLLEIREEESLSRYFSPPSPYPLVESYFQEAKSPLDMAVCLKKTAPQWLVENIIQYQYDIRWNTFSGEPNDYTFYQFCEEQNSTDFLKYYPRLAHVKATLYKERTESAKFLGNFSKGELCPNVFVKTLKGWKRWNAMMDKNFQPLRELDDDLSWINQSIWTFIARNADTQRDDKESLKRALKKPTLYWAVLEDTDFKISNKLKLKEIGRTQVYVGKANNGVLGRWMKDSDNHCEMMKKCLDNVYAMTTYDPLRLEGIQLVDARLALAKVRRECSALFVMKTFGDDVEKAEIAVEKAEIAVEKADEDLQEALQEPTILPSEAQESIEQKHREELEKCEEELAAARETFKDLEESSKPTKLEVEAQLKKAEKWHRMGKKHDINSRNIIPYADYRITWKPTDMAYGMNYN